MNDTDKAQPHLAEPAPLHLWSTEPNAGRPTLEPNPEHLQLALEASGTGLWTWDLPTDVVRWSAECYRIHGMSQDEVPTTGAEFFEWVHADDRARVQRAVRAAIDQQVMYEAEFRIVRPSGEIVWVANRGRAIYDDQGQAQSVMGTIVDINARKQLAAAQSETQALYQALAEELPNGAAFVVDRALRFRLAAGQALGAAGHDASQYIGRSVLDTVPAEAAEMVMADYRRALSGSTFRREHTIHGREFVTHGLPLRRPDGSIHSALAVSYDITERVRSEKMLRVRERELQTLADNLPDMLLRFDRDMRHVFVNAAVERLTDRPVSAYLGRTSRELGMPEQVCDRWERAIDQAFELRTVQTVEFDLGTPSGARYLHGRIVPEVEASGSIQYVLAIVTDMTAQRAAEEALIAEGQRKDEFLATLAHELRNPLSPLATALQILRREQNATAVSAKAMDVMDRQLAYLARLVEDLMDAARVGQGKVTLHRRNVPLADLIDRAAELSRPLLLGRRHQLTVQTPPERLMLHVDQTRVVQILSNLLNNAAKYTPEGGAVTLHAQCEDGQVKISVTDNGIGIPPHMVGRIFDLFTQVDDHRDQHAGGLGIGLALVHRLTEMHGGRVHVHSALGRGSTFTVSLPLDAVTSDAPASHCRGDGSSQRG